MGLIGRVIKSAVKDFLEVTSNLWEEDNHESRYCGIPGIVGIPIEDDQSIIIQTNQDGSKSVFLGVLTDQTADPGTVKIFGRDPDGTIKGTLTMQNDGVFVVNDLLKVDDSEVNLGALAGDQPVALADDVKAEFDKIKADIDILKTWATPHIHPSAMGPTSASVPGPLPTWTPATVGSSNVKAKK